MSIGKVAKAAKVGFKTRKLDSPVGLGSKKASLPKRLAFSAGRHPFATSGLLAYPALLGAQGAVNVGQGIGDLFDGGQEEERKRLLLEMLLSNSEEVIQSQEDEALRTENTRRIMQLRPDMAANLMAGRRLPPGAQIFGGEPRMDLLEEVAAAMANGGLPQQPEDPIAALLGGL